MPKTDGGPRSRPPTAPAAQRSLRVPAELSSPGPAEGGTWWGGGGGMRWDVMGCRGMWWDVVGYDEMQ